MLSFDISVSDFLYIKRSFRICSIEFLISFGLILVSRWFILFRALCILKFQGSRKPCQEERHLVYGLLERLSLTGSEIGVVVPTVTVCFSSDPLVTVFVYSFQRGTCTKLQDIKMICSCVCPFYGGSVRRTGWIRKKNDSVGSIIT